MPWGPPVLGAQLTSPRVCVYPGAVPSTIYVGSVASSPTVDQLLSGPFVKGLLELDGNKQLAAVGTSPDFPVVPKWRKVVRQIG